MGYQIPLPEKHTKTPVHIIHDKTFKSSKEAIDYANEKGFKITHIEKYFLKGTRVFVYKFSITL